MSGLGCAPCGSVPLGAGVLPVVVSAALVVDLTTVRLVCEPGSDPGIENPYRADSVYYWRNWELVATVPDWAQTRLVRTVSWDSAGSALVFGFDGRLQQGAIYELRCKVAPLSATFLALSPHASAITRPDDATIVRDWAKPERSADLQGGTLGGLQIVNGDYGVASGAASLHERIVRRVTTATGEFAHDPRYGVEWRLKGLLTIDTLQRLQSRLVAQIRREPDVTAVVVSVSQIAGAIDAVAISIAASSADGPTLVETTITRS